jgi:hypothetical protein
MESGPRQPESQMHPIFIQVICIQNKIHKSTYQHRLVVRAKWLSIWHCCINFSVDVQHKLWYSSRQTSCELSAQGEQQRGEGAAPQIFTWPCQIQCGQGTSEHSLRDVWWLLQSNQSHCICLQTLRENMQFLLILSSPMLRCTKSEVDTHYSCQLLSHKISEICL